MPGPGTVERHRTETHMQRKRKCAYADYSLATTLQECCPLIQVGKLGDIRKAFSSSRMGSRTNTFLYMSQRLHRGLTTCNRQRQAGTCTD